MRVHFSLEPLIDGWRIINSRQKNLKQTLFMPKHYLRIRTIVLLLTYGIKSDCQLTLFRR